jgi:hypothetical protein
MPVLMKAILLFGLNLLDAILTLVWVKNNLAEEGNFIMAHFLEHGETVFLLVKILIGALAVLVFYRWAHLRVTRIGLSVSLTVYLLLMGVHFVTGIAAIN